MQKFCPFLLACAICIPAQEVAQESGLPESAGHGENAQETVQATETRETSAVPDSTFRFSQDNVFTIVGVLFTHHALRNSETLHNWPFFAVAAPAVSSSYKVEKDFGKAFTLKGDGAASLTPMNMGISSGIGVSLFHLLELGIRGSATSAWNYGKTSTFMGVYDPGEKNFSQDLFLTEGSFSVMYRASVTIPLLAFLPKSKWTKIILKAGANLEYSMYTGAEDGEPWKAGADTRINGYRGEISGSVMYMLPFKHVNMAMLTAKVSGFLDEDDFDEIYKDYDPDFKTMNITPMVMFKINEKWSGMAMVPIVRERKFNKSTYESNEELMLTKTGTQWKMNVLMCMLNRKF